MKWIFGILLYLLIGCWFNYNMKRMMKADGIITKFHPVTMFIMTIIDMVCWPLIIFIAIVTKKKWKS